jgi:hypothetical protein
MLSSSLIETRPNLAKRICVAVLIVNVVGIAIYLLAASKSWVIPQEKGLNSTTGEPLVWGVFVLPIYGVFFVLNLIWGGFIVKGRQWRIGRLWLLVGLMWLVAIVIDFAHH